MRYTFAPLEGVTGYVYRNLHRRWFGGVERYYMPFISVGQSRSFSPREWQDFCPEHNESGDLVPQLLGKDAEGFPSNLPEDFLTGLAQAKIACAFLGCLKKCACLHK